MVAGVALRRDGCQPQIALRHDPDRARALSGFDAVALLVPSRDDVRQWRARARRARRTARRTRPGPQRRRRPRRSARSRRNRDPPLRRLTPATNHTQPEPRPINQDTLNHDKEFVMPETTRVHSESTDRPYESRREVATADRVHPRHGIRHPRRLPRLLHRRRGQPGGRDRATGHPRDGTGRLVRHRPLVADRLQRPGLAGARCRPRRRPGRRPRDHVRPADRTRSSPTDPTPRSRRCSRRRGRTFAITQTHWFRMSDGKVAEHWANRDDLGMGQQLGWNPPTPRLPGPDAAGHPPRPPPLSPKPEVDEPRRVGLAVISRARPSRRRRGWSGPSPRCSDLRRRSRHGPRPGPGRDRRCSSGAR